MEDFFVNKSSGNGSQKPIYFTDDYVYSSFVKHDSSIMQVVTYIIFCISIPLILVAIYLIYASMVRNDHVAPIYVINLLISDLIQLCCMIIWQAPLKRQDLRYILKIYFTALLVSVGFMVCLALERYAVIAHPLWYRFQRTIKMTVVVCVIVWVISIVYSLSYYGLFVIGLLLPFPVIIFSLVGTLRAISASISVPSDEKRKIVGILVLVLLIYTLLFLPRVISSLHFIPSLNIMSEICLRLSPLADLFLYVFIRKGTVDKLLASVCCCKMESNDTERTTTGGGSRSLS